jgi:hypothetical protein
MPLRKMSRDFLVALDGLRQSDPAAKVWSMPVGDFLGIDAFEVVVCLTELMEQDLVTVAGNLDGQHLVLNNPYTSDELVLTRHGREYLERL